MTTRLYETDSYCRQFTATVLSCQPADGGFVVELDKTAFFPEGGGQASDTGTLGDARVTDVQMRGVQILHTVDAPLTVGETVCGQLNWEQRFDRMQKHTAEHILSGHIHRLYGLNNVGFHLGSEDVTLDFDGELTREQLNHVEVLAQQSITENRAVTVSFPTQEQQQTLVYRSKKEVEGALRIVTIAGVDTCACCAPHVGCTGEIGTVKMLECIRWKGGVRIHMLAGPSAQADYQMRYEQMSAAAAKLSVKQSSLAEAVERLLAERDSLRLALRESGRQIARLLVDTIPPTDRPVCLLGDDWDNDMMRQIVNGLVTRCGGVCAVFAASGGGYRYVIGGNGDLPAVAKQVNVALTGRGGGSAQLVQGSVQADAATIRAFWEQQNAICR